MIEWAGTDLLRPHPLRVVDVEVRELGAGAENIECLPHSGAFDVMVVEHLDEALMSLARFFDGSQQFSEIMRMTHQIGRRAP